MLSSSFCIRSALFALIISAGARAQSASEGTVQQPVAQPDAAEESTLSGSFGIDFASNYYFRGFLQEDQGVIAQPWIDLGYTLMESKGSLDTVNLNFGTWNSLHDGPSGTGGSGTMWYESDFYSTLSVGFLDNWTADLMYIAYTSPNSSFTTSEELDITLSFDDSSLWGDSFGGVQPNLVLGREIVGEADFGGSLGTYFQVAIEPAMTLFERGSFALTGSLPITAGFSLDNYYEDASGKDQAFGFFDIGVALSAPVTFLPARYGGWDASFSVHYVSLGDTPKALNGGDDNVIIASFGLSTSF